VRQMRIVEPRVCAVSALPSIVHLCKLLRLCSAAGTVAEPSLGRMFMPPYASSSRLISFGVRPQLVVVFQRDLRNGAHEDRA